MLGWFVLLVIALLLIIVLAPREKVALFWNPEHSRVHPDKAESELSTADLKALREKIAEQEAAIPGVTDGAEKCISFSSESRPRRTRYCILYIHGFSACRQELSPIPEEIAKSLHANLYATRLTGHGLDGEALAAAKPADWIFDVMEAWAVARQLGEKVIVMATSTGATLTTWLAQQPQVQTHLAGLIMVSPNFQPSHWATPLFLWPWSRRWLPLLSGDTYGWEPANEGGAKYWTYRYPVSAVFGMTALVRAVKNSSLESVTAPTLFVYSDADKVVKANHTDKAMKRWGAPIKHRIAVPAKPDDNNHVIAGDIVRPEANEQMTSDVLNFLKTKVLPE